MPTDNTPDDIRLKQERFLSLLLPVRNNLVRFARALTRDREAAEDLVSDTILIAFERFDRLQNAEAFLGYLFTIATRRHHRLRWRRRLFGSYDADRVELIASTGTTPESSADVRVLREALARLPARQSEAVTLFEIAGLSLQEIRAVQGGSLSGVKSRIVRGRARLAELLGASADTSAGASGGATGGAGANATTGGNGVVEVLPHRNGFLIYSDLERDEPAGTTAARVL